jgi:hypothetical protein
MVVHAVGDAGLVDQGTAVAGSPVETVGPGPVRAAPAMVGYQRRKNLSQPGVVARMPEITPFGPGQNVGAAAVGIKGIEAVTACFGVKLAADETILMLVGVKVVEHPHKIKEAPTVKTILAHEGHIPHKEVAVMGG